MNEKVKSSKINNLPCHGLSKFTQRCHSPYRTTSYFGFPLPEFSEPEHFHFPKTPTKYVPLRRSRSLTEVFSSEKFSTLLDESPMTLPYAGRYAVYKVRGRKLLFDNEDVCSENPFRSMSNSTYDVEFPSVNEDLLQTVDNKIAEIKETRPSEAFIKKISDLDYSNESPIIMISANTDLCNECEPKKPDIQANSIEDAILFRLELGDLDRSEGTIFHKIENEIKNKKDIKDKTNKIGLVLNEQNTRSSQLPSKPNTPLCSKIPILCSKSAGPLKNIQLKQQKLSQSVQKPKIKVSSPVTRATTFKSNLKCAGSDDNICIRKTKALFKNQSCKTSETNFPAFKKKETKGSSSLWIPVAKTPPISNEINASMDKEEIISCINRHVDRQKEKVKKLENCQDSLRKDMYEVITIQNHIHHTINHSTPNSDKNEN